MFLLAVCIAACLPVAKNVRIAIENHLQGYYRGKGAVCVLWNILFYSIIPVILLMMSTASLFGDSYNPFIYFQF